MIRFSRMRFSFGLRIVGGNEKSEAEVASEAEGERAAYWRGKAQLDQAAERVRVRQSALAAEAIDCSFPLHAGTPQVKFRNLPTVRR